MLRWFSAQLKFLFSTCPPADAQYKSFFPLMAIFWPKKGDAANAGAAINCMHVTCTPTFPLYFLLAWTKHILTSCHFMPHTNEQSIYNLITLMTDLAQLAYLVAVPFLCQFPSFVSSIFMLSITQQRNI